MITQEQIDEAIERIQTMPIEEFEALLIKYGHTPKRKEVKDK